MAGTRDHPFEDLSNWMQLGKIPQTFLMNGHDFKASWINTIGDQGKLPYMRTPALLECCLSDRSHPASFFKLDFVSWLLRGDFERLCWLMFDCFTGIV